MCGQAGSWTAEVRELAAALFMASLPAAAAVEIIYEFIATEISSGPGLVGVFTPPYVRESVYFGTEQHPHGSKRVGRVLKGI